VFRQKAVNECRSLVHLFVEGEVAGVEDMDFRIRHIALVSFGLRQGKGRIILTPQDKQRWMVAFQPLLREWVGGDVGLKL